MTELWGDRMAGLVNPAPADARSDKLFSTRHGFLANLNSIADYIVRAAVAADEPSSMTFAIYGKWGAGKSSALRVVEDRIKGTAEKTPLKVTFTHFDSPLWERFPDIRPALAYEIVKGISPEALTKEAKLLALMTQKDPMALPDEAELKQAVVFLGVLGSLPSAPVLEQWMRDAAIRVSTKPGENGTSAHIVMIDDLDRCSLSFTARLLAAMGYWQAIPGFSIFFIIAADRDHLLDSLRENLPRGAHNPAQALEKYVHLSVNMPGFLEALDEVASFLKNLTESVIDDGTMDQDRRAELQQMIEGSVKSYPNCVFAPLLELDEVGLTPRAVKHRFNTFMAEFKPQPGLEAVPPADLKDLLIKAFWPEFWWRFIWKLKVVPRDQDARDWDEKADWVDALTSLGRDLLGREHWAKPTEERRAAVAALAAKKGLDLKDIDPALVMYLAVEPSWQRPSADPASLKPSLAAFGTPPRQQSAEERLGYTLPDSDLVADEQEIRPPESDMPTSPDDQVFFFRLLAEEAHSKGDDARATQLLADIADIAAAGGLQRRSAGAVGNAGLLAERMRNRQAAFVLHSAAHALDPTHWNVAQNFVEFILDESIAELYPVAQELLSQLRTQGSEHKPDRTTMLALQFAELSGQPLSPDSVQASVEQFIGELAKDPKIGQFARILSLGNRTLAPAQANQAGKIVAEAATEDLTRYQVLRALADFLAKSDDEGVESTAIDLYRYLLKTGLACIRSDSGNDVKHNLASLLAASGSYNNVAALLWEETYRQRPGDQTMRRAFAHHLDRLDREADAAKVLIGQELPVLQLTPEPLPDMFASSWDAWWENLTIEEHPPCLSAVPDIVPSAH
jgi:hypothetical protein